MKDKINTTTKYADLIFVENTRYHNIFIILFVMITIGLLIFKSNYVGLHVDEYSTLWKFSNRGLEYTLTKYHNTNNHLFNSVAIIGAEKVFGSYVHYFRIPSITMGILYILSITFILHRTLKSFALKIGAMLLVFFLPFLFNYLFLARGYAFGLGALFVNIAILIHLLDHPVSLKAWVGYAVVMSLFNFIAIGSLVTCVFVIFVFNTIFVCTYSHKIFKKPFGRIKSFFITTIPLIILTAIPTFLIYARIYKKIINIESNKYIKNYAASWNGFESFREFMGRLLHIGIIKPKTGFESSFVILLWLFFTVVLVLAGYRLFRAIKSKSFSIYSSPWKVPLLFFFLAGGYFLFMFFWGVILNKTLGLERSQVFFLPLFILSIFYLTDLSVQCFEIKWIKRVLVVVTLCLSIILNRVRPPRLDYLGHCPSRPTLRRLEALDSNKIWKIALSEKARRHKDSFLHYIDRKRYKFTLFFKGQPDVYMCYLEELPEKPMIHLDRRYFEKSKTAVLLLNPSNIQSEYIIELIPLKK